MTITINQNRQKKIKNFMECYYRDYNLYTEGNESISIMERYWSDKFRSIAYFPLPQFPEMDLATWKNFLLNSHVAILERMNCMDLSIDVEKMSTTTLVTIDHLDRKTQKLLLKISGMCLYDLEETDKGEFRIIRLRFFCSDPVALIKLLKLAD